MIKLGKAIVGFVNWMQLLLAGSGIPTFGNSFYLARIKVGRLSRLICQGSQFLKTTITVTGEENVVEIEKSYLSDSSIIIAGRNNRVVLHAGVKLRDTSLVIRGSDCLISIGANTTFGGTRIVNVGKANAVVIGEGCLFSDNIEIWASDTHEILDETGTVINREKPISIGRNVWVGSRVIILKGVTVAEGSVIGMGSIVTRDIPRGVISAGSPSRTLREKIRWQLNYPAAE